MKVPRIRKCKEGTERYEKRLLWENTQRLKFDNRQTVRELEALNLCQPPEQQQLLFHRHYNHHRSSSKKR
ncbi:hypothetical protein BGX34_009635 [Mortierella sp. NVP85]|nr:hypothetical protein BGX34_009635 [Mortierella sp. NVP85]